MTLQLYVSPCAHAVVRGSPDPALSLTGGLQQDTTTPSGQNDPRCGDDLPTGEPPDQPEDDGDWDEFDPTPLEKWILDDFDWEIEESYPERGDYWDDSLDGQWDLARNAGITNAPPRRASSTRMIPARREMPNE